MVFHKKPIHLHLASAFPPQIAYKLISMENVYEYKMGPNRKVTWFAAACIGFLVGFGLLTSNPKLMGLVWGLSAVGLIWILMKSPTAGIRLDHDTLTLSAWRDPQEVPLDYIKHVEILHWTENSAVKITYRDGKEEFIPSGDLPDMKTFSKVMLQFHVRLINPRHAFSR